MTTFVLHISTASVRKALIEKMLTQLPPYEVERAEGMGWAERRSEFITGRSLLRYGFQQFAPQGHEWRLEINEHGRPALAGGQFENLRFNIAHTDGLVCCAFSTQVQLGLDVERASRVATIDRVKAKVFSMQELLSLEALTGTARDERLLDIWTGKEAVTKALGIGLGYDFRKLTMDFAQDELRIANEPLLSQWRFERKKIDPDYRAVLASDGDVSANWCGVTFEELAGV
ncbi:MAG: 4'-phosphopantetheinyl transferase superfamily protein [Pseudomonadota bacterium]